MSAGLQIQMTPPTPFTMQELDTLLHALETRVKAKEIMHRADLALYLGVSERTVDRCKLPYHYIPGTNVKVWIRSEVLEGIKNHKQK